MLASSSSIRMSPNGSSEMVAGSMVLDSTLSTVTWAYEAFWSKRLGLGPFSWLGPVWWSSGSKSPRISPILRCNPLTRGHFLYPPTTGPWFSSPFHVSPLFLSFEIPFDVISSLFCMLTFFYDFPFRSDIAPSMCVLYSAPFSSLFLLYSTFSLLGKNSYFLIVLSYLICFFLFFFFMEWFESWSRRTIVHIVSFLVFTLSNLVYSLILHTFIFLRPLRFLNNTLWSHINLVHDILLLPFILLAPSILVFYIHFRLTFIHTPCCLMPEPSTRKT